MPTYVVTDSRTGVKLRLTGDSPPTEAELTQLFAQHAPQEVQGHDPTEGMSTGEKFAAAYGGVLPRLATGLKQNAIEVVNAARKLPDQFGMIPGVGGAIDLLKAGASLGNVNDETVAQQRAAVDEAKRLDAPLLATGAGKMGNLAGGVAAALPTAFVPGANTYTGSGLLGGLYGMLEPVGTEDSRLLNTTLGGLTGVASQALGRGLGALYQAGKAYVAPLTEQGQEKIVAETLKRFSNDPAALAAAGKFQSPIPGTQPTLAEASLDPGLATLQLAAKNADPMAKAQLVQQEINNNVARLSALSDIAKTPADRAAAVAARDSAAQALYGNAFNSDAMRRDLAAQTLKARAQAATGGIGTPQQLATAAAQLSDDLATPGLRDLAKRPAFQSAIAQAKSLAADKGVRLDDPLQSLEGLHYIKLALDDMLEPSATNALSRNARGALADMKSQLLKEISTVSPTYDAARATFAELSQPINQMDIGQTLYDKLVPALTDTTGIPTRVTANQYAAALRNAEKTVQQATGMQLPIEKIMAPEQLQTLQGIASDLGRKAVADDMARTLGSTTAQNFAAQNLMRQTLGPLGVPSGWMEGEVLPGVAQALLAPYKLTGADKAINQRLVRALMNPQEAADLVQRLAPADQSKLIEFLSRAALPAGIESRNAMQQ